MNDFEFECPICEAKLNSKGEPFGSVRAVALHIATRIRANNSDHRIWAYEYCSQEIVDEAIAKVKSTNDINILGNLLLVPVKQWHDDRGKQIGFRRP
jgi:hypothetical protein